MWTSMHTRVLAVVLVTATRGACLQHACMGGGPDSHAAPVSPPASPQSVGSSRVSNPDASGASGRRTVLAWGLGGLLGAAAAVPTVAVAADPFSSLESWSGNPLTSKTLEGLRIRRQQDADNRVYGGELAAVTGQPNVPADLLVPIITIQLKLARAAQQCGDAQQWQPIRDMLATPDFGKKQVKKVFNAYSDNIYYSDSQQANLYLAGGASPSTLQTTQYMLRNEALTAIENAYQETEYLLRIKGEAQTAGKQLDDSETEDLRGYLKTALDAIGTYLEIPPPNDVEAAKKVAQAAVSQ